MAGGGNDNSRLSLARVSRGDREEEGDGVAAVLR